MFNWKSNRVSSYPCHTSYGFMGCCSIVIRIIFYMWGSLEEGVTAAAPSNPTPSPITYTTESKYGLVLISQYLFED